MTPRDFSASFDEAEAVIRQQLSNFPDATVTDSDRKNRITIVEAPEGSATAIRDVLGERFFVDINAPLKF